MEISSRPALKALLPTTQAAIKAELHELVTLIEYRAGVMGEGDGTTHKSLGPTSGVS